MANTKITIMPDDRLPLGKSYVYISSVHIEPVPSAKGGYFDATQLELYFLYKAFNMTVRKVVNIPIFWSDESTFVKMLRAFGIMKSIGEDTDIGDLAHKFAEVTVVETSKNDRVYRNVKDIVPMAAKPHPLLQKLYDASEEARRMSNNIFDDDEEIIDDTEETSEEPSTIEVVDNDQQVHSVVSEEDANAKLPPPSIPGIKRRKPGGSLNGSKPKPLKSQLFDDNEDLGNF